MVARKQGTISAISQLVTEETFTLAVIGWKLSAGCNDSHRDLSCVGTAFYVDPECMTEASDARGWQGLFRVSPPRFDWLRLRGRYERERLIIL
jgi:hypothetical protein